MFNSLRKKIVFSTLTLIMLLGILAIAAIFYYTKKTILVQKEKDFHATTVEISRNLEIILSQAYLQAGEIASNKEFLSYLQNSPQVSDVVMTNTLKTYSLGDYFSTLSLIDMDGKVLLSSLDIAVGRNVSSMEHFRQARHGKEGVEFVKGPITGEFGYFIAKKISTPDGLDVGVVSIKLNPQKIAEALNKSQIALNGDNLMMVDEHGVVIHSNKEEQQLKSLVPLEEWYVAENNLEERLGRKIESLTYSEALSSIRRYSGPKMLVFYDQADGEEEISSVVKIGQYPFFVISEAETEKFTESAYVIAVVITLILVTVIFFGSLVNYFIIGKILHPIEDLRDAMSFVAKGDLEKKVEIASKDEIGDLAKSFNSMLGNLKESRDSIEKKVDERTKELSQLNEYMVGRELKMIELKKRLNAGPKTKNEK